MPYAVGHVTRFSMIWVDSRFGGRFRNILHFRGIEATMTSAQMLTFLGGAFITYLQRVVQNLTEETNLSRVEVANLTDLDEPTVEKTYTAGEVAGELTVNDDDVPQAAACITRKSFLRGRKAIGHIYHGPLPSAYTSEGILIPDPIGSGDLTEVLDAYGDPLVDGVTGWSARPIVCNAAGTGVVANNDVRTQSFAVKTVYLKSRRPGVGE